MFGGPLVCTGADPGRNILGANHFNTQGNLFYLLKKKGGGGGGGGGGGVQTPGSLLDLAHGHSSGCWNVI